MKQVINRRIYDTAKATVIAEEGNAYPTTDFKHEAETLYRTDKGRWFLHGIGGALSAYAMPVGDMYGGGESIEEMDDEDAINWLERHNLVSILQKYFEYVLEEA